MRVSRNRPDSRRDGGGIEYGSCYGGTDVNRDGCQPRRNLERHLGVDLGWARVKQRRRKAIDGDWNTRETVRQRPGRSLR